MEKKEGIEGETEGEGELVDEGKARCPPRIVFIIIRRHDEEEDNVGDGIVGLEEGGLVLLLFR